MKIFINRWLLIILLALMVINIAVLSTVLFHAFHSKPYERENHKRAHQHFNREEMRKKLRNKLQSELQLDDLQMKEIDPIFADFEKNMDAQRDSLFKNRATIMHILSNQEIDTVQIQKTVNRIGSVHVAMKMESIRLFLQIRKLCNDSQKEKLHEFFSHIMRFEPNGHRHQTPPNDMPPPPPMPEFDKE